MRNCTTATFSAVLIECQLVPPFHRHFDAQVTVAQGFGQGGDASCAALYGGLQAHEQVQRGQGQHAEGHRQRNEALVRVAVVVAQALVQGGQRLHAQCAERTEHGVDTALETGGIELDGAAEDAVVQNFKLVIQQLQAVVVLRSPGLHAVELLGLERSRRLGQLVARVAQCGCAGRASANGFAR